MAVLNLKTILPNDSQIVITDKINYNFDQLLSAGGGPPGDPGIQGNQGIPGYQGIQGPIGPDGTDGNKWYVGFGIPPTQPSPEIYVQGDFYLNTADNYIWEFDGVFWQNSGLQLAVSGGEFKSNTAAPANTATILQSASKNLVISSIDYNGLSQNPTSPFYNAKLKIVSAPGVLMEMGLDLGGFENQASHVTFELDGSNTLIVVNNGAGITLGAQADININTNTSTIFNGGLLTVGQSDGQYTGTIINGTDLVNKDYVDNLGIALAITGAIYDTVIIAPSLTPTTSDFMKVRPTKVVINEAISQVITDTRLEVKGGILMEAMNGNWDKSNPSQGRYQKKGNQLECWGTFAHTVTNTNDVTFSANFPVAYGTNNAPVVNVTYFPTTDRNEAWSIKQMTITPTGFTFKLFYSKKSDTPSFVDHNFTTSYAIRVLWHAVGGLANISIVADGGGSQTIIPPVT